MGSLCHLITDGKHGDCQNEDGSGYYFISSKDVNDGKIHYENARQITYKDFLDTYKRTQLEPLDILITNSGTIGRMAIVRDSELTPRTTFQKSVAILKPNKGKVLTYWLFYYLQSNKDRLISYAGGTAQKNLLLRDLRAFDLELPPLILQEKIASILSAYDDLIENNTRRIKILEEMARLIYREWFVEFKAPGIKLRKATTEENKVTGKDVFPEGWKIKPFTDWADVLSGGTPKTDKDIYWNGTIAWFTPRDVGKSIFVLDTERRITQEGLDHCNSKLFPKGTIFITARGTVGNLVITAIPMAMSQTNYALVGKKGIPQAYVFHSIGQQIERLKKGATGAVFDTIIVDTFRKLLMIRPDDRVLATFDEKVSKINEMILLFLKQNNNLRRTRDLLLPKLISGEVEV